MARKSLLARNRLCDAAQRTDPALRPRLQAPPHHVPAKQSFQEAEHYEALGKLIEALGGEVPTSVPAIAAPWSKFLWDSMDRHPLGAIAAWYASETSATGALSPSLPASSGIASRTSPRPTDRSR